MGEWLSGRTTNKSLLAFGSALVGAIGLMSTLHARFVVPSIMRDVGELVDEKIQTHANSGPHPGAVDQAFLAMITRRLDRIEDNLDALRADRIDDR